MNYTVHAVLFEREKYYQNNGERRCIGRQPGKLENDVDRPCLRRTKVHIK